MDRQIWHHYYRQYRKFRRNISWGFYHGIYFKSLTEELPYLRMAYDAFTEKEEK